MFADFYEWLKFLKLISREVDYDWYIKSHPDASCETLDVIQELFGNNEQIKIVPSSTSHFQLVDEGVNYAFTAHGSVGHEYAMMGVKVVNAAFNPHIAYNFNYHAKNIEDYKYAIKNLRNLNIHICKDEIYEFYYMRYFYVFSDNIVFYSYKSALKKIATDNVSIVRLFLNEIGTVRHNEIIKHIKGFLTSEKRNYFEYSKSLASEKDENFV